LSASPSAITAAAGEGDAEGNLAASAVWGQAPPAGPQWVSRLAPLEPHALYLKVDVAHLAEVLARAHPRERPERAPKAT
jgi:hypothetical protein